ncbi:MAG: TetR/AcrR family transcriptional regulator [Candidatus Rokuibacteriota bacterium]
MAYRRTARVEMRLASNRARILRAAKVLVSQRGFRQAYMGAVAASAGMAIGTVYRYFPSKSDLFAEVVATTSAREVGVVAELATGHGPAAKRLAEGIRAFVLRAIRGRGLAYALIAEPSEPPVNAVRLRYRQELSKVLEGIVSDGIRDGEFPPQDAEVTASCLVGAFLEALVRPLAPTAEPLRGNAEALVDAIVTFCVRAVRAVAEIDIHG